MRIKVINPNTTTEMTKTIERAAKAVANKDTSVFAATPSMGPASVESLYDEFLCIPGVLEEVQKGEREDVDAYIIACFGDPGLLAAREMTTRPVLGIAQSAMQVASVLAAKFSIITALPRDVCKMEELVHAYGAKERIASIRPTPLGVLDFNNDPEKGIQALRTEAMKAAREDRAEAILLGCAGMAEFADVLERELGIPVIDGVAAAVKLAEGIAGLGKRTSKANTYSYPERKSVTGLLAHLEFTR